MKRIEYTAPDAGILAMVNYTVLCASIEDFTTDEQSEEWFEK